MKAALLALMALAASPAAALDVVATERYALSIAGIGIGEATVALRRDEGAYAVDVEGGYRFLFWSGAANAQAYGDVVGGAFAPAAYRSRLKSSTRLVTTKMEFMDGAAKPADWRFEPPLDPDEYGERHPLTAAHLAGAADPLTAFMIPAATAVEACRGALRIYSGVVRFDLALTQRPDGACRADYSPVAGHRVASDEVDRLRDRGLELNFFEIAPGLWAPSRLGFPTRFGTLAFSRME